MLRSSIRRVSASASLPLASAPSPPPVSGGGPATSAGLPLTYEQRVWSTQPLAFVCGADEAGRGPLAGPVVAAACVVLPPSLWEDARTLPLDGVRDSKTVGEEEREALFPVLLSHRALAFGVSVIDHHAIDRVNILAAAMLAMERAVAAARAEAARRVGAREPSGGAALPREDALDASLCVAPTPAKKGARAPLLHTVFIDGPRCPTRVAAAAEGIVGAWNVDGYTGADAGAGAGASAGASDGAPSRKRARTLATLSAGVTPTATSNDLERVVPGATIVNPLVDSELIGRIGPIFSAQPIIKGDSKVFCIAAASLVAKVVRDRIMRQFATKFPGYGFEEHKGYGTSAHMRAIVEKGPSPIHRATFAPMKTMFPERAEAARTALGNEEAAPLVDVSVKMRRPAKKRR